MNFIFRSESLDLILSILYPKWGEIKIYPLWPKKNIKSKKSTEADFFEKQDLHIHVPEGATPKDGPSAGITMCTAIASLILDKKVKANLAMTGEITLAGKVLKIGGLKEKLIAAKRSGITNVIIPHENKGDLEEIEANILKDLNIHPVKAIEEVLEKALV